MKKNYSFLEGIKKFVMYRDGQGVVLEGIIIQKTKQVIIRWFTPEPSGSIVLWNSMEDFKSVHVDPHPEYNTHFIYEKAKKRK